MRYYATASGPRVREAMRTGLLGHIATPASGHRIEPGVHWCADNGAYTGRYPGDTKYLAWLSARAAHAQRCAFATAPDLVGDATATLTRSAPMLQRIRALGYPAALVAQDGLEHLALPWDDVDVLFLGGTTAWKLGTHAAALAAQARYNGLTVHMGRVNSLKRLRHAAAIGCHSVDGTYLAYGPDRNLPTLLGWLAALPPGPGPTITLVDPAARLASGPPTPHPATSPGGGPTATPNTGPELSAMGNTRRTRTGPTPARAESGTAGTAPSDASVRDGPWTLDRIHALGATTELRTAAAIFGLSKNTAYDLARRGEFPVPVLRVGARYRVPVPAILAILGGCAASADRQPRSAAPDPGAVT